MVNWGSCHWCCNCDKNITGNLTVGGNADITGVLAGNANVDSVGVVTARSGIEFGASVLVEQPLQLVKQVCWCCNCI